jgi:uncharacterized protein
MEYIQQPAPQRRNNGGIAVARVAHFELNADNPERAAEFYRKAFGWQITKWEGPVDYWLVTTGPDLEQPGINGAIMKRIHGQATVNTVVVQSIDEYLSKVTKAGGTIAAPKMAIPGVGYQAYCKDTEGNLFGIHQTDMSVKG